MYLKQKSKWIDFFEAYKEMSFLWDPKNKDYTNRVRRNEGTKKLYETYKKIDSRGILHMKKKIYGMRTTYIREMKKIKRSQKKGENYTPTLWYFKYLSFLDGTAGAQTKPLYQLSFKRYNNQLFLEKQPAVKLKKDKLNLDTEENDEDKSQDIEPVHSSEDEENSENIQPSPPKTLLTVPSSSRVKKLCDFLQKQHEFVEKASKILAKKEEDWQVVGKSIGLQLYKLEPTQRFIAHKLISDAIYYGSMEKLTVESYVQVENVETEFDN